MNFHVRMKLSDLAGLRSLALSFMICMAIALPLAPSAKAKSPKLDDKVEQRSIDTPIWWAIIRLGGNLDFEHVAVGTSSRLNLTISNVGGGNFRVDSISYPDGFSGDWRGIVYARSSETIPVTFSPDSASHFGGLLTINYNHDNYNDSYIDDIRQVKGIGVGLQSPYLPWKQGFSKNQQISATADNDWSFMTCWNLGSGDLQMSSNWYNGRYSWNYALPDFMQWNAIFIYKSSTGKTQELMWSYCQPYNN